MAITSAIVLFAVLWFLVLFVTIPIRLRTQGDEGDIVPGTQAGAPANFRVKRTLALVTVIAFVIWAILASIIFSGMITIADIDLFKRFGPQAGGTGG